MKAWEVIKHLEEGGEIEDTETGYVFDKGNANMEDIYFSPEEYLLLKKRVRSSTTAFVRVNKEGPLFSQNIWERLGVEFVNSAKITEDMIEVKITIEEITEG